MQVVQPAVTLPACGAQTWAFDVTLPAWLQDPGSCLRAVGYSALTWTGKEPASAVLNLEGIRQTPWICHPRPPEAEAHTVMAASLLELSRNLQADRRRWVRTIALISSNGIQPVRAASFIQIREPELDRSDPRNLPATPARVHWRKVQPLPGKQIPGAAVTLRPTLRNPQWRDPANPGH